ncbi:hypothetical protein Acr_09g0002100 [Actinidia rufa]|uniref:Uncharacterized protein n=1 Tax=Actinidia rufa TaxID=165716 RepID=A0A7J0F504_9ERIC|nr:hypothetical protein Acr_09g0002100 [Actinidia rufa]
MCRRGTATHSHAHEEGVTRLPALPRAKGEGHGHACASHAEKEGTHQLGATRRPVSADSTIDFDLLIVDFDQFDDEMQALLLLSSFPESWETLVASLSNSAPNGKLTTSMVMDALFNEEAQRREMGSGELLSDMGPVVCISEKNGQGKGKQPLHRGTQSKRMVTWGIRNVVYIREERWSHDNSQSDVLYGAPRWGGAGHLGEKVQVLRCGGAYTSVGSGVAR